MFYVIICYSRPQQRDTRTHTAKYLNILNLYVHLKIKLLCLLIVTVWREEKGQSRKMINLLNNYNKTIFSIASLLLLRITSFKFILKNSHILKTKILQMLKSKSIFYFNIYRKHTFLIKR